MSEKGRFELRKRARRRALQAIYQWQITRQDASEISRQFRQAQNFSEIDEAHFEDLLTGVIRELETLDSKIEPFLDRPLEQVDLMEKVVLVTNTTEIPNDTISVIPNLLPALKIRVRDAFLAVAADPVGAEIIEGIYNHFGYAPAKDSDYDGVRVYLQRMNEWDF